MAKKQRPSLLGSIQGEMGQGNSDHKTAEVVPLAQPAPTPSKRADVVKSTIYLPPQVHRKLKEIAFAKDCKLHDLIMKGVSRVLVEHGYPTVDELKEK
ncbi:MULTISPECIES: hypothetical protein [Pseudomonadota]|uniref:hypothetical protein n=1 Tax=Pseudomonadota TaxID=1224 RepID=UPI0032653488